MTDILLSHILEQHLLGRWQVTERISKNGGLLSFISKQDTIELHEAGTFMAINGEETYGTWKLLKKAAIIYNPQIIFRRNDLSQEKALITRYFTDRESENDVCKLRLYFNENLEVCLKRVSGA